MKRALTFFFTGVLILGWLSACTAADPTQPSTLTAVPTETPLPLPSETLPPTLAPTLVETPSSMPEITETETPVTPKPTEDILRFTFPTPASPPVSIWRPPLYPVPWALNPEDHFLFVRPIAADVVNWVLADYRYGGIFPDTDIIHTGIDIDAPLDTPVYAVGSGIVRWAGFGLFLANDDKDDPYGLAVAIEHDFGYKGQKLYTIYAHMDRIDVIKGQQVTSTTQLGVVGRTGNTTGPHLHLEVRLGSNDYGSSRNPELWLSPPQGWGVLVGRVMWSDGNLMQKKPVWVRSLSTDQKWEVVSYGPLSVHGDAYYRENLVLSDLPAGDYEVSIAFYGKWYRQTISIQPGAVTYFTYKGIKGFSIAPPPTPAPDEWLVTPLPTP